LEQLEHQLGGNGAVRKMAHKAIIKSSHTQEKRRFYVGLLKEQNFSRQIMKSFCKPLQTIQSAKILTDRNHLFVSTAVLKYGTVDVHALVTARKSENGEDTLLRGQFKTVKHSGTAGT